MGLDYYYGGENKTKQQHIFATQIQIANQLSKPVIIHTRSAREDTIRLLKENQAEKCGGVLLSFYRKLEMAKTSF